MATMTRPDPTPTATVGAVLDFLRAAYDAEQISWGSYLQARRFVSDVHTELPTVRAIVDNDDRIDVTLTHRGVLCDCGKGIWCPLNEQTLVDDDDGWQS